MASGFDMTGSGKEERFSPSLLTPELADILKLNAGRFKTHERKPFFMKQIVKLWDSLPLEAAMACSL